MHFPDQRALFVHIPKTGGNFLTRALVSASEDRIGAGGLNDGRDWFELTGPMTRRKHFTLGEYAEQLGPKLSGYRVYATLRAPLDRLLSLYFSPSRWVEKGPDGKPKLPDPAGIRFDAAEFAQMVGRVRSSTDFLDPEQLTILPRVGQPGRHRSGATLHLLSFDDLSAALHRIAGDLGIPALDAPARPVNPSANAALKTRLLDDPDLQALVADSRHARDNALF